MAFDAAGWSPDSRPDGIRIHTYTSTDTQDTVSASGYFDSIDTYLNAGDKIEGYDSTNSLSYVIRVSAITSGVVTTVNLGGGIENVITTNTIAAGESGKTFTLDLAAGFASTLPTAALGLKFRFVVKTAPTGSYTVVTASSANVIYGSITSPDLNAASDVGNAAASDTITFVLNKSIKGDWVEVECLDGTNWYAKGVTNVFDGVTLTQAS